MSPWKDTKNQTESFNGQIWEHIRRTKYIGIEQLELRAYDALAKLNTGRKASIMLIEGFNTVLVKYTIRSYIKASKKRLRFVAINERKELRGSRKYLRLLRKKREDTQNDLEGKTYVDGAF